jgi:putative ABC transport system permease protein
VKETLRQLFRDMRSQKLRTFLTVFGIVWGTVAVTLLLAFGRGMHKQIVKNSAGLGDRIAIAWPGLTSVFEGLGRGRRIRLQEEHIEAVRRETPGLVAISSEYDNTLKLHYGMKTVAVDSSGVDPCFGAMRNLIPQEGGRFINPIDLAESRRVLFLGDKIAKDVFGKASLAVGKTVLYGGSPFLIVGVLQEKVQNSSYNSRDESRAYMPGTTFRALTGAKFVNNFVYQPITPSQSKAVTDAVRGTLARALRFDPTDKEALSVWDTADQFAFLDVFFLSFRLFLGVVGCFTLIVGGIGVSNIMNVVVEERTKEIGIKMALGARQRWILRQFLFETAFITGIGGAIGFAISFGICLAVPKMGATEFVGDPEISLSVAALTAVVLGATALLAGYFPAKEASRLDPVVAMKL